jgi:hypothetical protein
MKNELNEYEKETFCYIKGYQDLLIAVIDNDLISFSKLYKNTNNHVLHDCLCIASIFNSIDITNFLIELNSLSYNVLENYSICEAYEKRNFEIVDLLFKIESVRSQFKIFNPVQYNNLIQKSLKLKIVKF